MENQINISYKKSDKNILLFYANADSLSELIARIILYGPTSPIGVMPTISGVYVEEKEDVVAVYNLLKQENLCDTMQFFTAIIDNTSSYSCLIFTTDLEPKEFILKFREKIQMLFDDDVLSEETTLSKRLQSIHSNKRYGYPKKIFG